LRARRLTRRSLAFSGVAALGLSAGLLMAGLPAAAQTLENALAAAYRNNPTLLAQRAKLRSTDEQVPQALSNWRPTVEVTASTGLNRVDSNVATQQLQHREPNSVSLDVTQPLFRGGRTLAATSEAENTVRAERARLAGIEQKVMLDATTAYLDVYRDLAVLDLNRNNEQVLRRQLEATRDRFQVGEITRTDVFQAEARLARATADRIQSEGNLETSRAAYANVVGEPPPGKLELPKPLGDLPVSKDEAARAATTQNPNVVAAEFDQRAALDRVDGVWGELLPTVSLTGSASRELQSSNEKSNISTLEGLLKLTVPLNTTGSTYSRLRAARQTVSERRNLIDKERRDAAQVASRAWETVQSARARVDSIATQIRASTVALEGVQREAAVGSRTVLDVLDAEQELLDAKVNHVRAQRDELVATFELVSAVGQLTARDMKLNVDLYDPTLHYNEVRDKWFGGRSKGGVE
jgi:outer membrane protein